MRIPGLIVCLFLLFTACKDSKKEQEVHDPAAGTSGFENNSVPASDTTSGKIESDPTGISVENKEKDLHAISGTYVNTAHEEDTGCKCYCLDVNLSGATRLCITEDKLYIEARFENTGDHINLYYTGKAPENSSTKIPWEKFETNIPIAVLEPAGKGFKLDWKGFSIDGEIALDYALLGKKTLEGTYKKQ